MSPYFLTGYASTPSPSPPRNVGGQTNVIIDRVKTRDTEIAIEEKIVGNPDQAVRKLENDVRQACAGSLVTFANRLLPNAEKRLNLTLSISPGYKVSHLDPKLGQINLNHSKEFQNEPGQVNLDNHCRRSFNCLIIRT